MGPRRVLGVCDAAPGRAPWTEEAASLRGGNWLSVSPPSGALAAVDGSAPLVTVSVNPQGLAPGRYYGLVRTRAPGAANTPQALTAFLDVQAKDTDLAAVLRPSQLVLNAPA